MIAAWMCYCTLCALGLGTCGLVAERALIAGRGPVRYVWIAAIVLSVIVPAVSFRFAPRTPPVFDYVAVTAAHVRPDSTTDALSGTAAAIGNGANTISHAAPVGSAATPAHWLSAQSIVSMASRADAALRALWLVLSSALAIYLVLGIVALAWMRRRWARREIFGTSVFVSERTGPAVVGVVVPTIVLPEWSLAMDPAQLELMLRHEVEHQRAGDGRLLVAAQLAAIAMPWNVGLWWLITRLRVALELDCDARVLRGADARAYGDLLLEVARPRRGPGLVGATAFAERATQLERRIRVLARHRVRTSRLARSTAVGTGLIALAVAWVAPHPSVMRRVSVVRETQPVSISGPDPVPASTLPIIVTPTAGTKRTASASPINAKPSAALLPAGVGDVQPATDLAGATARVCLQSLRGQQASLAVDSVFDFLFEGITLTADAEAKACDLLTDLRQAQDAQDQSIRATLDAYRDKSNALRARRDTLLRALLTNDADRVRFDANQAEPAAGGRGRSGGPPPGTVGGAGGRGAGGRGLRVELVGGGVKIDPMTGQKIIVTTGSDSAMHGRGGFVGDTMFSVARGGGRGRGGVISPTDSVTAAQLKAKVTQMISKVTLERLFNGITLTPAQESAAQAIVSETQSALMPPIPPRPALRFNPRMGRVTMSQASADELIALAGNEEDQQKVRGRINVLP